MKSNQSLGKLYIVATPIGNLNDISQRAIETLRSVDIILCENTVHSRKLLQHYQIVPKRIDKITDHQTAKDVSGIAGGLLNGQSVAYISDAGTPMISDPGGNLVSFAHQHKVPVVPVPGTSAVITALSVAGFAATPFCFLGFFPEKAQDRRKQAEVCSRSKQATVFFESPRRIEKTIACLHAALSPQQQLCIVREATKLYEQVWVGRAHELDKLWQSDVRVQGEFTVVVAAAMQQDNVEHSSAISIITPVVKNMVHAGMTRKDVMLLLDGVEGVGKNTLSSLYLDAVKRHEI